MIASPGGSKLTAGNGNITLQGGPGSDILLAGVGNQTLIGGGGNDTLVGGVGNDTLQGGNQPVTFQPGEGNDTVISPVAGNTLSYAAAIQGVEVNLSNQLFAVPPGPSAAPEPFAGAVLPSLTATGGFPGTSVDLSQANINHVIGTPHADVFVTGSGNDNISGNSGSDLFVVLSGNNTLTAGAGSGSRFLFEGSGNNIINGGGSSTVDFSQAASGVTVNLQAGTATGGFGGFQSLAGVLSIIGTNSNDVLVAGAPGGEVIGLNGGGPGDLLQAGPSGGSLLVSDGSGNDTFCAMGSCAVAGTSGVEETPCWAGAVTIPSSLATASSTSLTVAGGSIRPR